MASYFGNIVKYCECIIIGFTCDNMHVSFTGMISTI